MLRRQHLPPVRAQGALALGLACGLSLALAGCGRDDIQEILGEVRSWPGHPDLGGTAIAFEEFKDEVGEAAATERRVLIRTREAYQSLFGHAPPAGVNLPEDWVIFYAAGVKPTGGYRASVQHLVRLEAGKAQTLRAVTRLASPGKDCAVTQALTRPHVLVKFKAQPAALSIEFLRQDVTTDCGSGTPTPPDPCATVRCAKGTHCEVKPVVCVRAPCPPVAECVPDGPFCGGIAGIPCPGVGQCQDDPSDSCDPTKGGADCGGICACTANANCADGTAFDPTPTVCACVRTKPQACGKNTCAAGQVCCNASCGICTAPGGACIQIACTN